MNSGQDSLETRTRCASKHAENERRVKVSRVFVRPSLLMLVVLVACDDDPPQLAELDQVEEEVYVDPCPPSGGIIRAAPVLLEMQGMANTTWQREILVNNGGTENLCFDENFYSAEAADADLVLRWLSDDTHIRIAPAQKLALQVEFTPERAGQGEVVVLLQSLNGGVAEFRLRYTATPCVGEACPAIEANHFCASTASGEAGRASVRFDVSSASRLAMLTAAPGVKQMFHSLTPPTGAIDTLDGSGWRFARRSADGFDILMPAVDSSLRSLFTPGTYELEGSTDSGQFCVYVFDPSGPAKRLAMNFYAVGIGMSAAALALNINWHNTLDVLDAKLLDHGITLDRNHLGYFTVPSTEAAKYSTLRSDEDFHALLRLGVFPTQTSDDDLLRLNVFLINQFDLGRGGVIGLAPLWGIPGGHGSSAGGIAVAAGQYLGVGETVLDDSRPECFDQPTPAGCFLYVEGNRNLALVIIHEAGHFFGLPHTSELDGSAYDNFADTPECANAADPQYPCGDASNIMFPQLRSELEQGFSTSQLTRVLLNPLVQP